MTGSVRGGQSTDLQEMLSQIIQELNERFGIELTEADRVTIEYVQDQISQSAAVSESLEVNPMDKARMTFNLVTEDIIQSVYKSNFNFYRQVNDNKVFKDALFTWLFDRYLENRVP